MRQYLPLFLISFATLFFEVLIIRWIGSEIRIFAFFKNLILMGAFLGMGLGCATSSATVSAAAPTAKNSFPLLFAILTLIIACAPYLGLTEMTFNFSQDTYDYNMRVDSIFSLYINTVAMISIFLLVVSIFASLGSVLGEQLAGKKPLPGYTANLLGSLAGVMAFSIVSFCQVPPVVWLVIGFASLAMFYKRPWHVGTMVACLVLSLVSTGSSLWSPYYRIDLQSWNFLRKGDSMQALPYKLGEEVRVNHSYHQRTIDLSDGFLEKHPELRNGAEYWTYNLPFVLKPNPERALVMGAGTGNDVAAALRHGAREVDAVEIDPVIQRLGKSLHPEKPYDDPRVRPIINDARNFIASSKHKYDVIVFGLVDSHVALGSLPSVRLDNYLYTKESLADVTAALKPDGIAALSFACGRPWLKDRLYQLVSKVSEGEPIAFDTGNDGSDSTVIAWGPGLAEVKSKIGPPYSQWIIPPSKLATPIEVPTDDWPFIYLRTRQLSYFDYFILGLMLLVSFAMIFRRFYLKPGLLVSNSQFFLLGSGFLLMETRAMLASAVLFGSTWIVNSIAIALVILMALLANLAISKWDAIKAEHGYCGLMLALAAMYAVPLGQLSGQPHEIKLLSTLLLLGLPFFFAGIVFSRSYSRVASPEQALGMNILGAVLGGCLEYFSMIFGAAGLALLAIVIYALAWLAMWKTAPKNQIQPSGGG
jgi:hypothetical protein